MSEQNGTAPGPSPDRNPANERGFSLRPDDRRIVSEADAAIGAIEDNLQAFTREYGGELLKLQAEGKTAELHRLGAPLVRGLDRQEALRRETTLPRRRVEIAAIVDKYGTDDPTKIEEMGHPEDAKILRGLETDYLLRTMQHEKEDQDLEGGTPLTWDDED